MALDVLRGFALLGILVMNIPWFARSESAFFNPTLGGGFEGANYAVWLVSHLVFDMKMWSIFSMLFGAGMLIFTERAMAAGRRPAGLYFRRVGWLLVFGLLHAYLLWSGDILFSYAICGAVVYLFRRLRPRALIVSAGVFLAIGVAISVMEGQFFESARDAARSAEAALAEGKTPSESEQAMLEAWRELERGFAPDDEANAEEAAAYLGSYWDLFQVRAADSIFMQTFLFPTMIFWRAMGMMLLGMALWKWKVLSGSCSTRLYLNMAAVGYVVGLPLIYWGARQIQAHEFDIVAMFKSDWVFNYVGSILVALGHIGAIMLLWRSGAVSRVLRALAPVGQMALTNYLTHSVLCSIIFYGWGFGLWGSLTRVQTAGIVVAIWVFQVIVSNVWLRHFRYGPAEWLWRSLTYLKLQPVRRTSNQPDISEVATPV
ncbi:MAG: DUF418 domain-containing protein [Phycisphaerales bacterium]|nr:DUF418 domain-containing protein [Phycisphaerales bacterium]